MGFDTIIKLRKTWLSAISSPSGGMADALASGASARKGVEVRLLSWAHARKSRTITFNEYLVIVILFVVISYK